MADTDDDFDDDCDCADKVPHDLPEDETWTCPKCDAEWWGDPSTPDALEAEG